MASTTSRFLIRDQIGALEIANRAVDLLGLLIAALLISQIHPFLREHADQSVLLFLVSSLLTLLIFQQSHLYRSWRGRPLSDQFSRLFLAILGSIAATLVAWKLLGLDSMISLTSVLLWQAIAGFILITQRTLLHLLFRSLRILGNNTKSVVICGWGELGKSILSQCRKSSETGFEIVGILDDTTTTAAADRPPILGPLSSIQEQLSQQRVDEIWIALPLSEMVRVEEIVRAAENHMTCVRLFPDIYSFNLLNHSTSELLGFPIIDLSVNHMDGINRLFKELEDRVLGFLFFLISLPVMGLIALAIKSTSSGPVIFRQKRLGRDGYRFTIYKFRTMINDTDPAGEFMQAKKDDPRFTGLGRWLRKTSLDELPQLFNVLQGKMSLVGPRPHAIEQDELFQKQIPGYLRRNRVKPGITGWAQVNDLRGEVHDVNDVVQRLKHDLYYIEHWSIWFDLRIILATLLKMFFSKKAW